VGVVEIAERTWRIESLIGARNLFQYLIAGEDEALLVDTGTSVTPRDAILPALRHVGTPVESVRFVVVTHPDLDHQGGLAGLREALPRAIASCGFADRALVSEPDRLIADRYERYEAEHGVGYGDAEKAAFRNLAGSPVAVDVTFAGGEEIELGARRLSVLHAPGHSAGHLVLHEPATGLLFTSDAVHWRFCPAADGRPACRRRTRTSIRIWRRSRWSSPSGRASSIPGTGPCAAGRRSQRSSRRAAHSSRRSMQPCASGSRARRA
jgi:glyoxylase-like metal-dependent hydrolase (beta-lactamase superfamily II)